MGKKKKKKQDIGTRKTDHTNASRFLSTQYSDKNKSPRQKGIEKRIIETFIQGEAKGLIKTDKDSTYLRATITVANEIRRYVTEELGQPKLADPKFWTGKLIDTYFEKRYVEYMNGEIASGTVAKELHALEAFRTAANSTNVYGGEKIRIGNHEERRENFTSIGATTTKREITAAKVSLDVVQKVHSHIDTSTHNGEQTYKLNRLQSILGGRITAMLNLEARNIEFNEKNKTITATFIRDKNKFTRTAPIKDLSSSNCQFIKEVIGNKTGGQKLFNFKNSKGETMSNKDARKTVQEKTKKAAEKSGFYKNGQRFNTHSNRKGFAQEQYDKTKYYSKSRLYRMISEYLSHQGSNEEQIRTRLKNELKRINKYRTETGKQKRSFSQEECRVLYVSLLLGHSRINIVNKNYVITDKEKAKMEAQAA